MSPGVKFTGHTARLAQNTNADVREIHLEECKGAPGVVHEPVIYIQSLRAETTARGHCPACAAVKAMREELNYADRQGLRMRSRSRTPHQGKGGKGDERLSRTDSHATNSAQGAAL